MEATRSSEKSDDIQRTTRRYMAVDRNLHMWASFGVAPPFLTLVLDGSHLKRRPLSPERRNPSTV
jgi:hypothetical protein